LILGGHDHLSTFEEIGNVTLIKSGSDFEEFSDLSVDVLTKKVTHERVRVISSKYEEDASCVEFVKECTAEMNMRLEKPCWFSTVDLDGLNYNSRTKGTNVGNMLCDIVKSDYLKGDMVLLHGGMIRSDKLFQKGLITYKVMSKIIPMEDRIVQIRVPGHVMLQALE